jgi:hypothetical protein
LLEARWIDKLMAMRGPGESYSDVILRIVEAGPLSQTIGRFRQVPSARVCQMQEGR